MIVTMLYKSDRKVSYVEGESCYCCNTCRFFISPNSCQIVSGKIDPHGCCNLWQKGKTNKSCCKDEERMKELLRC